MRLSAILLAKAIMICCLQGLFPHALPRRAIAPYRYIDDGVALQTSMPSARLLRRISITCALISVLGALSDTTAPIRPRMMTTSASEVADRFQRRTQFSSDKCWRLGSTYRTAGISQPDPMRWFGFALVSRAAQELSCLVPQGKTKAAWRVKLRSEVRTRCERIAFDFHCDSPPNAIR